MRNEVREARDVIDHLVATLHLAATFVCLLTFVCSLFEPLSLVGYVRREFETLSPDDGRTCFAL